MNNGYHTCISEELTRLETTLKNLMHESGKKVNLEVEKIKAIYKNKLREANDKIESLRMVRIRITGKLSWVPNTKHFENINLFLSFFLIDDI